MMITHNPLSMQVYPSLFSPSRILKEQGPINLHYPRSLEFSCIDLEQDQPQLSHYTQPVIEPLYLPSISKLFAAPLPHGQMYGHVRSSCRISLSDITHGLPAPQLLLINAIRLFGYLVLLQLLDLQLRLPFLWHIPILVQFFEDFLKIVIQLFLDHQVLKH